MIYVLKKTISVSFLSEISAVRKDRFTVFQRKLPLKDSDSSPKLVHFIVLQVAKVICKGFLSSDYTLHTSFHETPIQAMD